MVRDMDADVVAAIHLHDLGLDGTAATLRAVVDLKQLLIGVPRDRFRLG